MKNDVELIETKAQFAKRLKISRQAVQKHAAAEGFPLSSNGRVRVEAALRWLASNVGSKRGSSSASPHNDQGEPGSLNAARTELLHIQTERNLLALQRDRGELIPTHQAVSMVSAFMRLHRDAMVGFANRYGAGIAAEVGCEETALIVVLEARIRDALNEAADNAVPFAARMAPAVETSPPAGEGEPWSTVA